MNEKKLFIIAIDGTSGSGKGTLSRRLALHYNLAHLDTGNIYRAVAKKILTKGVDLQDEEACANIAKYFTFADTLALDLHQESVSQAASIIASFSSVRASLLEFQQLFTQSPPSDRGAVLDGRDIGTVICPRTPYKIYLTAKLEICALRRFKQLQEQKIPCAYDTILAAMQERDQRDRQRSTAPLKPAKDAYYIDSTFLNAEEAFQEACQYIDKKRKTLQGIL